MPADRPRCYVARTPRSPPTLDVLSAALALLASRRPVLTRTDPAALWIAASRLVLHMVVRLFAEARVLAPRELHALTGELAAASPERRQSHHTAWPRLIGCCNFLGNVHAPPFTADAPPSDEAVHQILRHLAADTSALTCEHLGVFHEVLLDHTLRADLEPVRRGGARKGAGSFYTRPQLTQPTVRRTLEPLTHHAGRLREPEQLLITSICDPAMGAGNFLLAALRVVTDLVIESLRLHDRLEVEGCHTKIRCDGLPADTSDLAVTVRRAVAERCLYGVDRDPLAAELARHALWLETGDRTLPPACLADKLRCGDALIGAWHSRVQTYPVHAWSRDAPDGVDANFKRHRKRVLVEPAPLLNAPSRDEFDLWCALWFWPAEHLDAAPAALHLDESARAIVGRLRDELRFFHWELEFPEVFAAGGFDAIVGNPPWEIRKPSSQEFFSAIDPEYRALGKQAALARQQALFAADATLGPRWRGYLATHKDAGNFVRHAAHGDDTRPFRHQGTADLSSYKLFVEQAHALLRPGGQLGLVVPSALYTDKGSAPLRRLLLKDCRWRWLYGFENRERVFDIHRSFKFAVVIAGKGGETDEVQAAFMRHDLADWQDAHGALTYPAAQLHALSPQSLAVLEICSERSLEILTGLHTRGVLLGDGDPDGWGLRYSTELHTTNDSHRFIGRERAEADGYRADEYGRWVHPNGDTLLPLYEGRMIGPFDASKKGWVRGKGRTAVWRDILAHGQRPEPQFLTRRADAVVRGPKAAYMRICSATNSRTVISTYLRDTPAGDSVFFFTPADRSVAAALAIVGIFNSFVYDFAVRARVGGLNLSEFLMNETPLIGRAAFERAGLTPILLRLACSSPWFAPEWLALGRRGEPCGISGLPAPERLRLRCVLDAVIAALYGLDIADLRWILRDCDHPRERLADPKFCRDLDPKGFWRVDRGLDPELRHSVLTLVAFDELQRFASIDAFLAAHAGAGWRLPATLRLADHDLGRDDRARAPQPVAVRLGPCGPAETVEGSWAACERHARTIADRPAGP